MQHLGNIEHAAVGFQLRMYDLSWSMRPSGIRHVGTRRAHNRSACLKKNCLSNVVGLDLAACGSVWQDGLVYWKTVQFSEDFDNAPELWNVTVNYCKNNKIQQDTLKEVEHTVIRDQWLYRSLSTTRNGGADGSLFASDVLFLFGT